MNFDATQLTQEKYSSKYGAKAAEAKDATTSIYKIKAVCFFLHTLNFP